MKEHLTIPSHYDQLPLDVIVLSPSHPKGIVQLSHGMCEHKERYIPFMEYLNQQGYVCCIHDHRGHGKSIRSQDDLGYLYDHGDKGLVEDLHQITLLMKERYPRLPLYLFGHSMGSLVVRCYLKTYDQDIDGLFVCGSPSENKGVNMTLALSKFITSRKGDHHRSSLLQKMSFQSYNKNFEETPNSWLSSDPDIVKQYNEDPLCGYIFTTNGFTSLFLLLKETYSKEQWSLKNKDLPIHFIAGENDPCIINPSSFNHAVQFLKDVGYRNVTSHLFQHMRHEILNEKKKETVYQHMTNVLTSWR